MAGADPSALEPIERASRDELAALQLARLRATLQHAYDRVPHYRRAFDAAGVHPSECRTLADLSRFPFTTKADLREEYPFGFLAVPRAQLARVHASSGTTGRPTVVGYTAGDIDRWADLVARSLHAAGARAGDLVHVAYGYGLFTGGLEAHYGAERLGCTVVPMGGGQTEKQVQLIEDFRPGLIMVTPSYMQVIIEEVRRQGKDPAALSLRTGVSGAEPWTEAMRRDLEQAAGIDAVGIYGLSEVMGPCADGRSARQQQASLGRATRTLRRNSLSRNGTVMVRTRVDGVFVAPRCRSAHARRGAGGAWRLQAPTPAGVAAVSVGVGPPASPADSLRRTLRARVWPMAPRRHPGRGQVPRLWRARARVRALPLRHVHARVSARVLA